MSLTILGCSGTEIGRLVTQKESLTESADKERLSFQLRIDQKQGRIDYLEQELQNKRKRLMELESPSVVTLNRKEYDSMDDERSRLKVRITQLEAALQCATDKVEQQFRKQQQRLESKIVSLEETNNQIMKTNKDLSYQASQFELEKNQLQSMARKENEHDRHDLESQIKKEAELERLQGLVDSLESKHNDAIQERNDLATKLEGYHENNHQQTALVDLNAWKEKARYFKLELQNH